MRSSTPGNPVELMLTPGQAHDLACAELLIENADPDALIGDKAYDADSFVDTLTQRKIIPVIPPEANRKTERACDFALYCERNLVERFFNQLKHFRAIATRYDKLARNFLAGVQLAAVTILLNSKTGPSGAVHHPRHIPDRVLDVPAGLCTVPVVRPRRGQKAEARDPEEDRQVGRSPQEEAGAGAGAGARSSCMPSVTRRCLRRLAGTVEWDGDRETDRRFDHETCRLEPPRRSLRTIKCYQCLKYEP